jgi:hypothetical protein
MRSCVFNDLKYDRKCLFGVAILDGCEYPSTASLCARLMRFRRCSDRVVHPHRQERLLRKVGRQYGFVPYRARRRCTCFRFVIYRHWCVSHNKLQWLSLNAQRHVPAYGGGVYADHVEKRKETSTLPIHLSGRTISSPVLIHAGQFSEYVPADDDTKFTEIPLRENRRAAT